MTRTELYKAIKGLYHLNGDVNQENLDKIIEYFHDDLLEEYNIERAERGEDEYDGLSGNARFDQRACERTLYLFQQ